jgi:penicillin-binding protein 2
VTEASSRVRLGIIGVLVIALFVGLFARLWFLQVTSSKSYAAQTEANRVRIITEAAVRGRILDRTGRVLVESKLVDSIQIRRGLTHSERAAMVPRLAKVLRVSRKSINQRLDSPRYSPYQPVPIADNVSYQKLVYIKERPELFPRVDVVRRSIRSYPLEREVKVLHGLPSLAAHLLGYVGAVNKDEQQLHKGEGYGPDDVIGKVGVEQVFESELRGQPHVRKLEVDSRGRLVRVLSDKPAVAGNDVQLSLDADVQRIAEESLAQGMKKAGGLRDPTIKTGFKTYGAKGGAAVVLDATDGSVTALASAPTFDLTKFTNGIPVEEFAQLNASNSNQPLLDRAIQGQYAPGSTFKLLTAMAALNDKLIKPDDGFDDRGFITYIGNPSDPKGSAETFSNALKEAHGHVVLRSAIQVSSDVYFYTLGFRFWDAYRKGHRSLGYGIQRTARRFGLGRATGVGLPNEQVGRVPDGAFKAKFNKNSPNSADRAWLPGDSAHLAVGQGDLLVTPIQLANAYATFVNGGTLFAPRLASRIVAPDGVSTVRDLPSQIVSKSRVSPTVRGDILPGLEDVVVGIGTAAPAFNGYSGLPIAGKTGTAQVTGKQDTSVFVGIVNPELPASDAQLNDLKAHQYVVVVFVEEGGNGGSVSAPIAKRIMEGISGNLNPPDVQLVPPKHPRGD